MTERHLMRISSREMMLGVKLHKIPKKLRFRVAEYLIAIKLHEFGIWSMIRQKCPHCEYYNLPDHVDLLAFKPFIKNPVGINVQGKSVSLAKHGYEIHVDDTPLQKFEGWYIVLIEREPEDIFLYAKDSEMRKLILPKLGGTGYRRDIRARRYLMIPHNLGNFTQYLDSNEFVKAVLKDPYTHQKENNRK